MEKSGSLSLRARFLRAFAPDPALPVPPDRGTAETDALYRQWRRRVLISTMIGYAIYYFVRKNLSLAMPAMGQELGIGKSQLGLVLTLHGVLYGVSRFAHGFLADKCNARTFMAVGLAASAIMNIGFGLSSAVATFGLFWMANGWVQGMGFPPVTRLMTHWYPPERLASTMSVWNTSHSIGAGIVVVMCGYLAQIDWRLCFYVPALIALAGSVFLWRTLPDTPPSVGLPEVAGTESAETTDTPGEFREILMRYVFRNKYIWLLAAANFFVYIVRYAVLDWGPTLLKEFKHVQLSHAGWMVFGFEVCGVLGMLACGWLTDKIFGGRGARACMFYMAGATLAVLAFWKTPTTSPLTGAALLCVAGFFIYGPQALIGIAVANLATKRAAATAAGFTGFFGYASTVVSGWGIGKMVETYGWDHTFHFLVGAGVVGTLLFAAAWGARAHGYGEIRNP